MARAPITVVAAPGSFSTGVILTPTTADAVNDHSFVLTGGEVLLVHNPTGGSLNQTILSDPDNLGRSGDITNFPIPAGAIAAFGPFDSDGWQQGDGNVYVEGTTGLVYRVLRISRLGR